MKGTVTYTVHVHDEGDDGLWATVEECPGVFASGFDQEELMESLKEGLSLYLSSEDSELHIEEITKVEKVVETVSKREFCLT